MFETVTHEIPMEILGLENVECTFEISSEIQESEPYSWGEQRGDYVEFVATLTELKIGNEVFNKDTAISMFGEEIVEELERIAENEEIGY